MIGLVMKKPALKLVIEGPIETIFKIYNAVF